MFGPKRLRSPSAEDDNPLSQAADGAESTSAQLSDTISEDQSFQPPAWPLSESGESSLPVSSAAGSDASPTSPPTATADEPSADDVVVAPSPTGPIAVHTYGERTTFGSEPWWSAKKWWKLSDGLEGNDIRTHVGTVGDLAVAATSLRGHRHRLGAEPNQDSFAIRTIALDDHREYLIVAVADGVGSSPHSGFGARLASYSAAQALGSMIQASPDHYLEVLAADQAASLLGRVTTSVTTYREMEFDAPGVPASELRHAGLQCTLTIAVVPAGGSAAVGAGRAAVVCSIGDSPAFRLGNGQWQAIDGTLPGESGLWSSAIDQGALGANAMRIFEVPLADGQALLLSTDGIGKYLHFEGRQTLLGDDLAARWKEPVGMLEFVRDASFEFASADDDRTAVMIWMGSRI